MLKDTGCWLCGTTNSIVTQQKEVDLLVNVINPPLHCAFDVRHLTETRFCFIRLGRNGCIRVS